MPAARHFAQSAAAFASCTLCLGVVSSLHAGSLYQFSINQSTSAANTTAGVAAPMTGTFVGDYDATSNPAGTQTRAGLFGGSGNNPIAYSGSITAGNPAQTHPIGSFRLDVVPASDGAGSVTISHLFVDALGETHPSFAATFNILYQSFHTVQPTSIFPGGVSLPVPLGSFVLDAVTITQAGDAAAGVLTPTGPNQYQFTAVVGAMIDYSGEFNAVGGAGTPVSNQLPVALAISGTLTIADNNATSTVAFDWSLDDAQQGPFPSFANIPLPVPTVLPPGSTANLLMSGEIQSLSTQIALSMTVDSQGHALRPGDANGDGVVNVSDLLAVIVGWGSCPPPPAPPAPPAFPGACPGDVAPFPDGNGLVNVGDLLLVVTQWGAGS